MANLDVWYPKTKEDLKMLDDLFKKHKASQMVKKEDVQKLAPALKALHEYDRAPSAPKPEPVRILKEGEFIMKADLIEWLESQVKQHGEWVHENGKAGDLKNASFFTERAVVFSEVIKKVKSM